MEGRIATVEEVKARWAYAEVNSSRFGDKFDNLLAPRLLETARQRVAFDDIARSDWPELVAALVASRSEDYVEQIDWYGASHYRCVHWRASRLLNCLTLRLFGLIPFFRFLAMPHRTDGDGNPRPADPRYASTMIPFDPDYVVEEPVVVHDKGYEMLLEGYLRSILWLRNPVKPLPVWLPYSEVTPASIARTSSLDGRER